MLVFCGDGALGAGVAYETLTITKLRRLPLLVVCEGQRVAGPHAEPAGQRAVAGAAVCGLGLRCREVDGNDLMAVAAAAAAAAELLAGCRAGDGPAVLVAGT